MANLAVDYNTVLQNFGSGISSVTDLLNSYQQMQTQPNTDLSDAAGTATSPYTFNDWLSSKGYNSAYDQASDTYKIGDINMPGNVMTALNAGSGTEQTYQQILDQYQQLQQNQITVQEPPNISETGDYQSPYQSQLQNIFDQLNQYTPYQTPEELETYLFNLLQGANQPFSYDPTTDTALKTAQQEAQRQTRESAGAKGTLYSSGTLTKSAKASAALIPQYEERQYQRYADQKNREIQMVTTLMQWDSMQADRKKDQLDLIMQKANYIMQLDSQAFEQFKLLIDQRNWEKEYQLEQQQVQLQRQIAEIEQAYARVEALGYVDNQTSIILGLPTGTKAQWVKQLEMQQKQELEQLKQEYEYNKKLAQSQATVEKDLIKYKQSLEDASQKKLMQEQYNLDKKLADYEHSLNLGGSIKGTAGIVATAKSLSGLKYVWGGTSPTKGMDCSGFTQYVMAQNGISIPRVSKDQAKAGVAVAKGSLQVGDLIFFDPDLDGDISHVGIYIGNGQMIHESSSSGVTVTSMNTSYWNERYMTARRVTGGSTSSVASSSSKISASSSAVGKNITSTSTSTIQKYLNNWGKNLSVDGKYGPATTAAVIAFQKSKGLTPDGIVGPKTLEALKKYTTSSVKKPAIAGG